MLISRKVIIFQHNYDTDTKKYNWALQKLDLSDKYDCVWIEPLNTRTCAGIFVHFLWNCLPIKVSVTNLKHKFTSQNHEITNLKMPQLYSPPLSISMPVTWRNSYLVTKYVVTSPATPMACDVVTSAWCNQLPSWRRTSVLCPAVWRHHQQWWWCDVVTSAWCDQLPSWRWTSVLCHHQLN